MRHSITLAALLLCACGEPDRRPPPAQVSAPPPAAASPRVSAPNHGLRFRAPSATELVDRVGQRISVGDTPSVLDLEDGTRVTATPGAQLWAFAHAKTLLLVSGELHATRMVDAQQTGTPPVRIACLAGVVEPNPGAELALRVELRAAPLAYRAQLNIARGSATWIAPHEHAAVKETQLIAGDPLPMPAPGLQWLSVPAGQKAQPERDKRFAMLRLAPLGADLDALLDAALTEHQALRQQGHALLAQVSPRHAERAQPSEVPEAAQARSSPRAFQRELVAQAQRREAQAAQLLSAAERSVLRALAQCAGVEPHACPSLRAWTERFAARLGASL